LRALRAFRASAGGRIHLKNTRPGGKTGALSVLCSDWCRARILVVPKWFGGRALSRVRGSTRCPKHLNRKHSLWQRCILAPSPRVPATRRRRENVMQSTYGSSPRGPLP